MDLFLDTNVWLSFYHYSNDDLEELRKLAVMIDRGQVTLHVTDQVQDEFRRNRGAKFNDALKRFKTEKLNDQFPQLCKEYEHEYEQLKKSIDLYQEAKGQLLKRLVQDFAEEKLKADMIIKELFGKANKVVASLPIVQRAFWRHKRGNPPGKKDSMGDAVNWECLLEHVEDKRDLYLIADDADYRAEGSDDEFSPFLKWEWSCRKNGEVRYYRRLSSFFKEKFPDIRLATELEKGILIDELAGSPTFKATRRTLRSLAKFDDFTDDQANEILEAAIGNNQVYWLGDEPHIRKTLRRLLEPHWSSLDNEARSSFEKLFAPKPPAPPRNDPDKEVEKSINAVENYDPSDETEREISAIENYDPNERDFLIAGAGTSGQRGHSGRPMRA